MLHDVGKAMVPVAILEKPGPLDPDEMAVMKKHPEYGLQALKCGAGLQPEMIDIVAHHHEYLDGSGYPHGLQANEISDLVRIMTICDVYSALIEQRAYKPPLSSQKAYELLLDMGPKLDKDLVREFSFVDEGGELTSSAAGRRRSAAPGPRSTSRHPTPGTPPAPRRRADRRTPSAIGWRSARRLDRLDRLAADRGARLVDAVEPLPGDRARQDGVHADAELAKLHRQRSW